MRMRWWYVGSLLLISGSAWGQMVTGQNMPGWQDVFRLAPDETAKDYTAQYIQSSAPGNILWPGEQATFTFQAANTARTPLKATGTVDVVAYGTKGQPGDIWVPQVIKLGDVASLTVEVDLAAGGFVNLTVSPKLPERFGAYALVLELKGHGRRFVGSCVRTFKPSVTPVEFPQLCLDVSDVDVLNRLGAFPNRIGIGYKPTTDKDFEAWWQRDVVKPLEAYAKARKPITVEIGGGAFNAPEQPLGRPRPWLNDKGEMQDTKFDLAWLPSYDPDFHKFVKRLVSTYGWPRGPVNGIKLWNEPWEGISISGWGADLPRYREIFKTLCEATVEARAEAGVNTLIGGCDSSSNTFDKLFGDGSDEFLKYLDFVSIHYQGMFPPSTVKQWVDRKSPNGRVRIWDTESWVANVDDRVAAVIATNLSTGHDRAVGIYGGNICTEWHSTGVDILGDDGKRKHIDVVQTWPVAAAVGAAGHFLGERRFKGLLFKHGLPWVMAFHGLPKPDGGANPDDGTVVVVGDIGEEFGADSVLYRTARGFAELGHKRELKAKLATLADGSKERDEIEKALAKDEPLSGASLTFSDGGGRFRLCDFYGNPVPATAGKVVVPLDHRGFYLKADGSPGSFEAMLTAIRLGRVDGIEPLATVCHDFTAPLASHPSFRLELTNVLNRPVQGSLSLTMPGLSLEYSHQLTLAGNETVTVPVKVVAGSPSASNTYPLSLVFDAGPDGQAVHEEALHVNYVPRARIAVDGQLDDWKDALPQTITPDNNAQPSLAEAAWFPFKNFDTTLNKGFATGWLAYDDQNLYFAAKVADSTPDEGMPRFATRDDDEYYYPETSYGPAPGARPDSKLQAYHWPESVRRYSYRKDPVLPSGNAPNHDNIQLAFNALPAAEKPWYGYPEGTTPGYIGYYDTDYEYALNPVAPRYGGGTEIWRLRYPGMPHKHFYPREGKSPLDGPAKGGQLAIRRDGNTRIVECALPWSEIPGVKQAMDAGRPVKFSFRVNDNGASGCMELSRRRSVAKRNGSFVADWAEHWANELEFGFGK